MHLKENPDGSFSVEGLQYILVEDEREALFYYEECIKHRATTPSQMNNKSSRSHAIFEIHMEKIAKKNKLHKITSKLRIVDLAGSEK